MIIEGQWAVSEFKNIDYGVAEVPAGTSGHSATNIGIGVASVFDHGTAANNAAITFVQWLASPAQGAYLTSAQRRPAQRARPSSPTPAVKQEEASQPTYSVVRQPAEHRRRPGPRSPPTRRSRWTWRPRSTPR